MTDGIGMILNECRSVVEQKDYSIEHDDEHEAGEMLVAALSYIESALNMNELHGVEYEVPRFDWPWEVRLWESDNPVRNLVKAGQLIAAEIDRLQRKSLL